MDHAHDGVQQHHHQHDDGVRYLFQQQGDGGRGKQNVDHRLIQLSQEHLQPGLPLLFHQGVWPILLQPRPCFLSAQAFGRMGVQLLLSLGNGLVLKHGIHHLILNFEHTSNMPRKGREQQDLPDAGNKKDFLQAKAYKKSR